MKLILKSINRLCFLLLGLFACSPVYAVVDPVPVSEPGIISLLAGAGAVAAVLVWRNRKK